MKFVTLLLPANNQNVMRITLLISCLIFSLSGFTWDGPVIDMHVHAWPSGEDGGPQQPKNQAAMQKMLKSLTDNNIVLAATSGPQEFLQAWSDTGSDRLMQGPIFPCIAGKNPTWFQYQCFDGGEDFPKLDWLEEKYTSGEYQIMGELYNQYAGIPFNDPRMDPYYALAERLGIPVAFHTHSAPPLTAANCCPKFRISNGNPLLLEDVLVKYPKLKVQIMHANPLVYPEVIDLLVQYPKVYVDISPWQMAYTRKKFHMLLQTYQDAGLVGRIMFGSDGHDYEKAFAAYESAEFLSARQLEGIFCKNAQRFLRKQGYCGIN
jgi:hypothetical protein